MNFIEVTHANNNQKILLVADLVCGIYYSPHHKATLITASGGAMFPAKESAESIKDMLIANINKISSENNKKEN